MKEQESSYDAKRSICCILQKKSAYAIMPVGKKIKLSNSDTNEKPQRSHLWGFSIPNFCGKA